MLKIGVLMPRSTLFPSFGIDILTGIKQKLKSKEQLERVKLMIDNIGFGVNEQEIYTKAEKFVLADDADVVVIVADYRPAEALRPFFAATNKVLIVLNCGADIVENSTGDDTTIIHSLNFALCAKMTGALATQVGNKEAIYALSYYDAGYFQSFSLINGHQETGGLPSFYNISKLKLSEFTLAPMEEFLQNNVDKNVTNVLCLFCGEQAEKFYHEILSIQKQHKLRLYVSPMMLHQELLDNVQELQDICGYVPWNEDLDTKPNLDFVAEFKNEAKPINYFSLLGWDAGEIITFILDQKTKGTTDAKQVITEMKKEKLESPRGWLKIDANSNYTYGPVFKTNINNGTKPKIEKTELNIEEALIEFKNVKIKASESSSWRNTYLCI